MKCEHDLPKGIRCEVCYPIIGAGSDSALSDGLCADSYEERIMEFEMARNEAIDNFFNAREGLSRTRDNETIFEGGFRMAWDAKESA